MPDASVAIPTVITHRLMSRMWLPKWISTSWKWAPRGMSRPKKFLIWLDAMSRAAPAVKPMMTVWEMKLTSTPSRASPITSWIRPVSRVSVSTRPM
jgi:hypothetical protein